MQPVVQKIKTLANLTESKGMTHDDYFFNGERYVARELQTAFAEGGGMKTYKIKSLVWEENIQSRYCQYVWSACDGQSYYRIYSLSKGFDLYWQSDEGEIFKRWSFCETIEEAKSCAQTHFESRIQSHLEEVK